MQGQKISLVAVHRKLRIYGHRIAEKKSIKSNPKLMVQGGRGRPSFQVVNLMLFQTIRMTSMTIVGFKLNAIQQELLVQRTNQPVD